MDFSSDSTTDPLFPWRLATRAWSVNNVMREFGVHTMADVLTQWRAALSATRDIRGYIESGGNVTLPTANQVHDGVAYLVNAGLATYDAGTDVITPTHTDATGKPARLYRAPDNEFVVLLLPEGATPTEGT